MRPIVVITANLLLVVAAVAATVLVPETGRPVVVLGWPWAAQDEAFRAVSASAGSIVAVNATAVIAISPDPNFVARLYRNGSVAVVDARLILACLSLR